MFTLVIGGAASGKSEYAESRVTGLPGRRIYLATMRPWDQECRNRIDRHRRLRLGKGFETLERYTDLAGAEIPAGANVLLECMSNLTANELYDPEGGGREAVLRGVDALLARFLPAGVGLDQLLPLLRREALEAKLAAELGPEPFRPVKLAKTTARALPLGVLFHIAPGNMPGLPVYTALEGLLTGNINLIKLPHGDKGLSLAAFQLLAEQEPRLAPYLYAFDLSSGQREELDALAALADGLVAWGGDGAIEAARTLAGPGGKLIEWGHRLSFAYVSGYEDREGELSSLAAHIVDTGQRLCSSCQVIFLDTGNWEEGAAFCRDFLPYLERAAAKRPGPSGGASASLSGHTALLERVADGRAAGEALFRGKGCSAVLRLIRSLTIAGEHIVGGDVYHLGAVSGGGLAEIANGSGVERGSLQIVGFGSVYGGVCGAIHYKVKFVFGETSANCIAVGDVKRVVVSVHGLYLRVILKFNP